MNGSSDTLYDIAVVGMAGRFPGAATLAQLWANLKDGVVSVQRFSAGELRAAGIPEATLRDPRFVPARGVLEDVEQFDADYFGLTRREAQTMDPQLRWFLMCAVEALESGGYDAAQYGGRIGVFAGASTSSYYSEVLASRPDIIEAAGELAVALGNDADFLTTRTSYHLRLTGPSMNVRTACSTSLVAVHLACQSLLQQECDLALAGGASIKVPQVTGYLHQPGGISSPDGHCRAFAADAAGTVHGSGVGLVLLKRLDEALREGDNILAVLKGSAVNNDGHHKVGFTAPSVTGQAQVIAEALAAAAVDPATLGLVEGHGTGTPLGDPIEVEALTRAFRQSTDERQFCALGSVKSNLGHLDAAAGVAGLIKVILALQHRTLPPTLYAGAGNPQVDWAASPFCRPARATPWAAGASPRRAAVSSFGIGGTNAHVIVEEAPARPAAATAAAGPELLVLSARSAGSLRRATQRLADHLHDQPTVALADVAFTLQRGRPTSAHRAFVVGDQLDELAAELRREVPPNLAVASTTDRPVAFLLPGQGAQEPGCCRSLYQQDAAFRQRIDECCATLQPLLEGDLRELLLPRPGQEAAAGEQLAQTRFTQPALFVLEYALARWWQEQGVDARGYLGHSIGELVAATLAGLWQRDDALRVVAARGRFMQAAAPGAMLAIGQSASVLQDELPAGLSVACCNASQQCTVAGPADLMQGFAEQLRTRGVRVLRLAISHAFHSPAMDAAAHAFADFLKDVPCQQPTGRWISNVTGTWIDPAACRQPEYWAAQLRQPVQFARGIATMAEEPDILFVEVGPGQTLSALVQGEQPSAVVIPSLPQGAEAGNDAASLLHALGRLWAAGGALDAARRFDPSRRRVALPTYSFDLQRYWVDAAGAAASSSAPTRAPVAAPAADAGRTVAKLWQELLGVDAVGTTDSFFELGGHSLAALQFLQRLRETLGVELSLGEFLERPRLGDLVARIRGADASVPRGSPLVALKPDGSQPPLFCVHPIGGTVLCYAELASVLPADQPLLALQAPAVDGHEAAAQPGEGASLEALAHRYVTAVLAAADRKPLRLLGWSFGGVVAWEMARQLEAAGREVSHLLLLDSPPPQPFEWPTEAVLMQWFFRDLAASRGLAGANDLPAPATDFHEALGHARQRWPVDISQDAGVYQHLFQVFRANVKALHGYQPAPVAARTLWLRSADAGAHATRGRGWQELSPRVEVRNTPGDHYTMLQYPHLTALATTLTDWLSTRDQEASA